MKPLGAILAGGQSLRYGAPKALAEVGGRRIIDRVVDALGTACDDLVLIANDPDLFRDLDLPTRPDLRPGLGALGGIHTALVTADEQGRPGIVAVACDMPFLSVPLLARLRDVAFAGGGGPPGPIAGGPAAGPAVDVRPDLVVPESRSRRGVEPLCAAYGTGCIPAIEAEFDRGDSHVIGFYDDVRVHRLALGEVEALCDPERAFLNVNTTGERDRAERLAGGEAEGSSRAD
ncbi:MAG TPA: molybdenum cofactor guanylyltransferase [Longimicrobiales bacterium]|nr:molybdenum cofactor guanylyltransferase [Longimicrobiales bacterium]